MPKTVRDIVQEARRVVPEVTVEALHERMKRGEAPLLLDVRDPDEYRDGYIDGALSLSRGFLEFRIASLIPDPNAEIVTYCQTGLRSVLAAKALQDLGYANVKNLTGGVQKWKEGGYRTVAYRKMTEEQLARYSRHLMLAQIGEQGQRKLMNAKVLLVGAGGLGSPAGVYLAAAGVGTLGVVDADVVDITNLQRQILHNTASVGKPKVDSAKETLAALNPEVQVIPYQVRLTSTNVMDIVREYDVVLDGSDNFETKYLVNDACHLAGKPNVYGSIFQFEGQASVFHPTEGPCYRCLFPSPPPPGLVPT